MSTLLESLLDPARHAEAARADVADLLADMAHAARPPARGVLESIGWWVAWHYRQRALESGTQTAARQLRKQGYPLDVALLILAPRP